MDVATQILLESSQYPIFDLVFDPELRPSSKMFIPKFCPTKQSVWVFQKGFNAGVKKMYRCNMWACSLFTLQLFCTTIVSCSLIPKQRIYVVHYLCFTVRDICYD